MQSAVLECEFVAARDGTGDRLVVVLHGRGDSAAGFRWLPGAMELPDVGYLLVNAPDPYFGGRSWYDLPPDQAPGVARSRALLDQLFEEILAGGYLAANVLLLGFSQGCLMTLEFGGRTAHALAGYVGISGYCLDPAGLLADLAPQARRDVWLVTHGTQDEVLPYDRSETQMQQLAAGGLPIRFASYEKGHTIDLERELPALQAFVRARLPA